MRTAVRTFAAAVLFIVLLLALWVLRPRPEPAPSDGPAPLAKQSSRAVEDGREPPRPEVAGTRDAARAAPEAETDVVTSFTPPVSEEAARLGRGLAWLTRHQADDGSWQDPATTGLALLAFLGAGETTQMGSHRDAVLRALKYLLSVQREDGCLARADSPSPLRDHALAGLALTEAYGMTSAKILKEPAARAVAFALRSRVPGSGWATGAGVDAEATGWMAMLVKSAQMSELEVDPAALTDAAVALDAITDPDSGRLTSGRGSLSDAAATAMAMWVRRLSGRVDDAVAPHAAETLVAAAVGAGLDDEAWYLGTIAIWHECGAEWRNWKAWMRARLPAVDRRQRTEADADVCGSWDPPGASTSDTDRVWSTALSLLGSYPYVCNWYPRTLSPRGSR